MEQKILLLENKANSMLAKCREIRRQRHKERVDMLSYMKEYRSRRRIKTSQIKELEKDVKNLNNYIKGCKKHLDTLNKLCKVYEEEQHDSKQMGLSKKSIR